MASTTAPDTEGFYRLSIRYKSSNGLWSETNSTLFYVAIPIIGEDPVIEEIVAAEYFFDTDPGRGNGIQLPIEIATNVDIELLAEVNDLPLGDHQFALRLLSSGGMWSVPEYIPFEVCTVSGPLASFNFIESGFDVFLESTSVQYDSLSWTFNNAAFSEAPFPTFTNGTGVYPITLTAFNECGSNSVTQEVSIFGIDSYSPHIGCNLGFSSIVIQGAGFEPNDNLYWLEHTDGSLIYPDTVYVSNNGTHAIAKFNLFGAIEGNYSLNVEVPNIETYTAVDSFLVTDEIGGGLSYTFLVPPATRPNQWRDYSLVINNNSNLDIEQVPFLIAFPDYADVEIKFENLDVGIPNYSEYVEQEQLPNFITVDSLDGQPFHKKVYLGLCPFITANSQVIYTVKARMNVLGDAKPFAHVYAVRDSSLIPINGVMNSMLDSRNGEINTQCFNLNADCVVALLGIANTLAGFIPGLSDGLQCASGLLGIALSNVSFGIPTYHNQTYQAVNNGLSYYSTLRSCGMAALSFGPFGAAMAATKLVKVLKKVAETAESLPDLGVIGNGVSLVTSLEEDLAPCFIVLPKKDPNDTPTVAVLASYDPNEISGIDEFEGYTNESTFTYTISCENDPNADLPAVEVNLYDTLDLNFFDPSTFRLNSITLPDTTIILPLGSSEFATEYMLDNGLLLRISAKLDVTTGVAHWRFISLDPITLDYPLDLSLGLLPPNVNAPEGEAFVTFSINRWPNTEDGAQVDNFASIIFDTNPPIITNIWENELDLVAPVTIVNPVAVVTDSIIHLEWTGADNRSGISYYTIYVSQNGGPFVELDQSISFDSINFIGEYGIEYGFYIEAIDRVGNREIKEAIAEVTAIPWPGQLQVQSIVSGPSCAGQSNASIVLNTYGGEGAYTYEWSNGSTLSYLENLGAGTYSVTIEDAGGESIFQEFTIEEPNTLIIQPNVNQPQCWYDTGSASLQITGGTEPYTINWNNVDPLFLTQGIYPVTVTDANGCETIREVIVEALASVEITYSLETTSVLCSGGNSGTASVDVQTSNGAVTVDWLGENPLQLAAGTYPIVLTDSAGCMVESSVTIGQPAPISIETQSINSDSETDCNGSIELFISGGSEPYTVQWNEPQGETGTAINNLCEGNYSALVTDANGCTTEISNIEIATSIGEATGINQLTITPNPSNGKYNLSVQCTQSGNLNWAIYDERGKIIRRSYNQWYGSGTHNWPINVDDQPNGIYLLQLQFEQGKITRQLIKVGM
jgi:hypothetical protein